jgi:hypothetical protein
MADLQGGRKRSLFQLFADVPVLVRELVAGEIELLKQEMIRKLKALGVGGGLILGAVVILLFFIGVLLTAAVLALSQVLPGWLSALIVAAALLVIAAIIGLIGYRKLKQGIPPVPTQTIRGLKKDLNVIKGVGKREKA